MTALIVIGCILGGLAILSSLVGLVFFVLVGRSILKDWRRF